MKYEIIEVKEKTVVGLLKRTTNENMKAVNDIACLWQKFMGIGVYDSIKNKCDSDTIGLYTNYESDFIACCEVTKIENLERSLISEKILAGKYAKFTTHGDIKQAVGELWQQIWQMNLGRIYSCDYEVYHNGNEKNIIDIYISIK